MNKEQVMSTLHGGWKGYAARLAELLAACRASDENGTARDIEEAFCGWRDAAQNCRHSGEIVFIGNGASASMASHCAADIMKNASICTRLFTDLSMITAMGNDEGYENVFMLPVSLYMKKQDLLVAISSSGRSPNILKAVEAARQKEALVVTLSAFDEQNPLRQMGHWNFYVDATSYGQAESCHAAILHYWMDMLTTGTK